MRKRGKYMARNKREKKRQKEREKDKVRKVKGDCARKAGERQESSGYVTLGSEL